MAAGEFPDLALPALPGRPSGGLAELFSLPTWWKTPLLRSVLVPWGLRAVLTAPSPWGAHTRCLPPLHSSPIQFLFLCFACPSIPTPPSRRAGTRQKRLDIFHGYAVKYVNCLRRPTLCFSFAFLSLLCFTAPILQRYISPWHSAAARLQAAPAIPQTAQPSH